MGGGCVDPPPRRSDFDSEGEQDRADDDEHDAEMLACHAPRPSIEASSRGHDSISSGWERRRFNPTDQMAKRTATLFISLVERRVHTSRSSGGPTGLRSPRPAGAGHLAQPEAGAGRPRTLELRYQVGRAGRPLSESWEVIETITLVWTPCHYGGQHPWFRCPGITRPCGRRVGVLISVRMGPSTTSRSSSGCWPRLLRLPLQEGDPGIPRRTLEKNEAEAGDEEGAARGGQSSTTARPRPNRATKADEPPGRRCSRRSRSSRSSREKDQVRRGSSVLSAPSSNTAGTAQRFQRYSASRRGRRTVDLIPRWIAVSVD